MSNPDTWMMYLIWLPAGFVMLCLYAVVAVLFAPLIIAYGVVWYALPAYRDEAAAWAIGLVVVAAAVLTLMAWSAHIFTVL